jgi:hypothetical protein
MDAPCRHQVCKALGVPGTTFTRFLRRYDLDFFPTKTRVPTRANGLVGELFKAASDQGMTMAHIGHRLPAHSRTVLKWRTGEHGMPLFAAQCLADLLGFQIKLAPKDEK